MMFRRLVRRPEGGVRVTLPAVERSLLLDVATTLRTVIADVGPDTPHDEITGRLFPRAYEDPLDQMQFAESMMGPLAESKRTLLDTFVESLLGGDVRQTRWRADLDDEQTTAWLTVLQDGRLVLAKAVGIETEQDWDDMDIDTDEGALVLAYLGELLNGLVELLMEGLPDDPAR
jgi:hypothetical protein